MDTAARADGLGERVPLWLGEYERALLCEDNDLILPDGYRAGAPRDRHPGVGASIWFGLTFKALLVF